MIYSGIVNAIALACDYHFEQKDKAGKPYILHLLRVGLTFEDDEDLQIIGVLHDILEDTECTVNDLHVANFSPEIVEAVRTLTRLQDEEYYDYVLRVRENKKARLVKFADLRDNSNLKRIKNPTEKDKNRTRKYQLAYRFLSGETIQRECFKELE